MKPSTNNVFFKSLIALAISCVLVLFPAIWLGQNKFIPTIICTSLLGIALLISPQKISFNRFDIIFLCLILWNGLSSFWAQDISLVIAPTIGLLFLFYCYKAITSIEEENFILKLLLAIISINLLLTSYAIGTIAASNNIFEFTIDDNIDLIRFFGENGNYLSSALVLQLPILALIYQKLSSARLWIAVLSIASVIFILLQNSRASAIALCIQTIVYLIFLLQRNNRKILAKAAFASLMSLVILFLFIGNSSTFIHHFNPLKDVSIGGDDRLLIWKNTLDIALQQPFLGIGTGNWHLAHFNNDVGAYATFFNKAGFYRHPHNQLLQVFSETGFIGAFLFLALFYFGFKVCWLSWKKYGFSIVTILPCLILVSYGMISSFYGVSYIIFFNPTIRIPQLILLITIAAYLRRSEVALFQLKPYWLLIGLIPMLGYYIQASKWDHLEQEFTVLKKQKKYDQALETLNNIYHPLWKAHNNKGALLSEKATLLKNLGKKDEAIPLLEQSLEQFPYFEDWYKLGTWYGQNTSKAKHAFQQAYAHNSTSVKIHLKLAQIALRENRPEKAKEWLNYYHSLKPTNQERESHRQGYIIPNKFKILVYKKFKKQVSRLEARFTQ